MRGPLADPNFRGQFSGHETFPLRYGWLNKVFDRVSETQKAKNDYIFNVDDAIVSFGVGRNMVSAMRHWGLAAGIIRESEHGGYRTTPFGEFLLGRRGRDPYLEDPASLWLIHWRFAGTPQRTTTWFWAFNHYAGQTFDRETLAEDLVRLRNERQWGRNAPASIRRDVDCFIRTYVRTSRSGSGVVSEDSLESPLAELGLIQAAGSRGSFEFRRGPKEGLPDAIFNYALAEFWERYTSANTLTVEAITYEPGAPGRVFKLDEEDVADRLSRIEASSGKVFQWTDAAGLRSVLRKKILKDPLSLLDGAFTGVDANPKAAE